MVCFEAVASSNDVSIRFAVAGEETIVSSVLLEAAEWLRQRGEPLWSSAELTPKHVAAGVGHGHFVLAFVGGQVLGTACLTADDPRYWPEAVAGEAMYVHRLAVRRSGAGGLVSAALLCWCGFQVRALGCQYLRLDCDAGRPRLRRVYENFGFEFHSERLVGAFTVARYQLALRF